MPKVVVVDSDAIYALYNYDDPLHALATEVMSGLLKQQYQLIYPSSVVFETVSLFRRVLPTPSVTSKLREGIKEGKLVIHYIAADDLKASVTIFNPQGNKKNTLVDCSVAAVARKLKAAGVFSFDEFYPKQGLKLAKDLVWLQQFHNSTKKPLPLVRIM